MARVAADPARIDGAGEPGGDQALIYYRLHGSPRMYYSAYSAEYLRELSRKLKVLRTAGKEIWCIFDNTALYEAWGNALELQRKLRASHDL